MLPSVCVRACVCQNKSATCLCNLLSAFNLPSAEKGRLCEGEREDYSERERRHSVRESDNHSVNGAGEGPQVIPYLSFLPLLTLFRTASLLFPASGGEGACEHKLPALV